MAVTMMHANGSHARKHWKDITEEPWRQTHAYQYVAIPKPEYRPIAERAVDIGRLIISNNSSGKFQYSQSSKRWNLWKNLSRYMSSNGCSLSEAIAKCTDPNLQCDCSSFVLSLYKWAGLPFAGTWQTYTGGLRTVLRNSKCFDIYNTSDYTRCPDHATPGALYWKENAHVIMACNYYNEPEPVKPDKPAVQPEPGDTLEILKGSYYIRDAGSTKGAKLGVAKQGDVFRLLDQNGWYCILYNGRSGYITNAYPDSMKVHRETEQQLPATEVSYLIVSGGTLRIRTGPGITYKTIGFTDETQKYVILDQTENKWFKVAYRDGTGYISGNTKYTLVNVD